MMRKRPNKEDLAEKFINNSPNIAEDKNGEYRNAKSSFKYRFWPFDEILPEPIFESGSNLCKSMSLPLKEYEWNSIDAHVKQLGLKKAEWIRHAIYKLLELEQKLIKEDDFEKKEPVNTPD